MNCCGLIPKLPGRLPKISPCNKCNCLVCFLDFLTFGLLFCCNTEQTNKTKPINQHVTRMWEKKVVVCVFVLCFVVKLKKLTWVIRHVNCWIRQGFNQPFWVPRKFCSQTKLPGTCPLIQLMKQSSLKLIPDLQNTSPQKKFHSTNNKQIKQAKKRQTSERKQFVSLKTNFVCCNPNTPNQDGCQFSETQTSFWQEGNCHRQTEYRWFVILIPKHNPTSARIETKFETNLKDNVSSFIFAQKTTPSIFLVRLQKILTKLPSWSLSYA